MKNICLAVLVFGLLMFQAVGITGAAPFYHHYDASVVPDDSSLQEVFSTNVTTPGANWIAAGGELTLTTSHGNGVWFGNHNPDYDLVPWDIADSSEGNFVSVRARLGADSGEWSFYLQDGSFSASYYFLPGMVAIGGLGDYAIDTSVYRTYSIHLGDGKVHYRIDGTSVYFGPASGGTRKILVIGDGSVTSISGYGSMHIDDVVIQTHAGSPAPLPGAVWLLCSGLLGLLGLERKLRS